MPATAIGYSATKYALAKTDQKANATFRNLLYMLQQMLVRADEKLCFVLQGCNSPNAPIHLWSVSAVPVCVAAATILYGNAAIPNRRIGRKNKIASYAWVVNSSISSCTVENRHHPLKRNAIKPRRVATSYKYTNLYDNTDISRHHQMCVHLAVR